MLQLQFKLNIFFLPNLEKNQKTLKLLPIIQLYFSISLPLLYHNYASISGWNRMSLTNIVIHIFCLDFVQPFVTPKSMGGI